jgi:cytochrome c-type biogenesis protein CcmH/NrfF
MLVDNIHFIPEPTTLLLLGLGVMMVRRKRQSIMELTTEHQRQIEAIRSEMKCPGGFKCQEQGFTDSPKVEFVGELLECLEKQPEYCPFSAPFGLGHFGRCPLNRYVHGCS